MLSSILLSCPCFACLAWLCSSLQTGFILVVHHSRADEAQTQCSGASGSEEPVGSHAKLPGLLRARPRL